MKLALAMLAIGVVASADDPKPPMFKITTRRKDDAVDVRADKGRVTFAVTSPFGIGHAVVERTAAKWPDAVVVRMNLKGLESFRVATGKVTLDAAVSSQDGKPRVRLWKDGKEDVPLDEKSPYWMEIRLVGADGKPAAAVPLKGGYFEVQLPAVLFEGDPESITLNWIDFYRD